MDIIISIVAIVAVVFIAIAWGGSGKGRGAFSAFLNLVSTIAAGAIAFATWEFATYNGMFAVAGNNSFLEDVAWAGGLLIPFAISLLLLKLAADALVPNNIDLDDPVNILGGLLFGGLSGAITIGMALIAISSAGIGPSLLGHRHIEDERGSLVYNNPLLVPFDDLTIALYETLSLNAFDTSNALARTLPNANHQLALARNVYYRESGEMARAAIRPEDVSVLGSYTITNGSLNQILDDSLGGFPAAPKLPTGNVPPNGSTLHGYVVQFEAGAKESTSQVLMGAGLVRLVAVPTEGKGMGIQPVAIIARAQPEAPFYRRYKLDAQDRFVPSVGAGAESYFAFEFPVPPNYTPAHLIIKNTRIDLENVPTRDEFAFRDYLERDQQLNSGNLLTAFGVPGGQADFSDFTLAGAISVGTSDFVTSRRIQLPGRYAVLKGQTGGLAVGGDDNRIISGQHTFDRESVTNLPAGPLRVDSFQVPGSATLVMLELVDDDGQLTFLGEAIAGAQGEVALISTAVERFPAIGYVYANATQLTIRYTPSDVIENLEDELPSPIQSGNPCYLIFHVTKGADITFITNDDTVLIDYQPPISTERRR